MFGQGTAITVRVPCDHRSPCCPIFHLGGITESDPSSIALTRMSMIKLPEPQQNRWKPLSFQVDFYCYYGIIRSHSTSLYLITVINLKSLKPDLSTKVIPWSDSCQARWTNSCQLPFPHARNFLVILAENSRQVLSWSPAQEKCCVSGSLREDHSRTRFSVSWTQIWCSEVQKKI